MISLFRRHVLCKIMALVVCFTFVWQSFGPIDEVRAQSAAGRALSSEIKIPARFGEIVDLSKGNLGKTIIHIRDAHCDYFSQNSISGMIGHLRDNYGIKFIALEGGSGDYDLSVFTDIKDLSLREKVADYFVRQGEVNGAEFFAINNPEKVTLYGIEEPALYIENLNAYRDSLKFKDRALTLLKSMALDVSKKKDRIYPAGFRGLDKKMRFFKEDRIGFEEYAAAIADYAKKNNTDMSKYPNIIRFYEAVDSENGVNMKNAERERNILIDLLNKRLSKKYLEELVTKTVAFNDDEISAQEYYPYLLEKAKLCGIELDKMSNLTKYTHTANKINNVDKKALEKEFKALEEDMCSSFLKTDEQRAICALDKKIFILNRLFSVGLVKDDWDYYIAHRDEFDLTSLRGATATKQSLLSLNDYRLDMEKFYSLSLKRDDVFLNKIMDKFKKEKNIILVTGGFHQDNLKKLFQDEGYSYVEVLPKIEKTDGENPYFRLLSGSADPITKAISEKQSSLQIASYLSAELKLQNREAFEGAVNIVKGLLEKGTAEFGGLHFYLSMEAAGAIAKIGHQYVHVSRGYEGWITPSVSPVSVESAASALFARDGRIIRIFGRDVVVVTLSSGGEQAFYRSTGQNSRMPDQWLPFEGISPNKAIGTIAWFNKGRFDDIRLTKRNPELYRYGTEELKRIGEVLDAMNLPVGEEVSEVRKVNAFINSDIAKRFNENYDEEDRGRPDGNKVDDEIRRAIAPSAISEVPGKKKEVSELAVISIFIAALYFLISNQTVTLLSLIPVFAVSVILHEASHYAMAKMLGASKVKFTISALVLPAVSYTFDKIDGNTAFKTAMINIAPFILQLLLTIGSGITIGFLSPSSNILGVIISVFFMFSLLNTLLAVIPIDGDSRTFWKLIFSGEERQRLYSRIRSDMEKESAVPIAIQSMQTPDVKPVQEPKIELKINPTENGLNIIFNYDVVKAKEAMDKYSYYALVNRQIARELKKWIDDPVNETEDDMTETEWNVLLDRTFAEININAMEAIEDRGVDGGEIMVSIEKRDGNLVLNICDTGKGIDEFVIDEKGERKSFLSEVLFKKEMTTKDYGAGAGMREECINGFLKLYEAKGARIYVTTRIPSGEEVGYGYSYENDEVIADKLLMPESLGQYMTRFELVYPVSDLASAPAVSVPNDTTRTIAEGEARTKMLSDLIMNDKFYDAAIRLIGMRQSASDREESMRGVKSYLENIMFIKEDGTALFEKFAGEVSRIENKDNLLDAARAKKSFGDDRKEARDLQSYIYSINDGLQDAMHEAFPQKGFPDCSLIAILAAGLLKERFAPDIKVARYTGKFKYSGKGTEWHEWLVVTGSDGTRYYVSFSDGQFVDPPLGIDIPQTASITRKEESFLVRVASKEYIDWYRGINGPRYAVFVELPQGDLGSVLENTVGMVPESLKELEDPIETGDTWDALDQTARSAAKYFPDVFGIYSSGINKAVQPASAPKAQARGYERTDTTRRAAVDRIVAAINGHKDLKDRIDKIIFKIEQGIGLTEEEADTLKDLRNRLGARNSLVALSRKVQAGDRIVTFSQQNIKFLNSKLSAPQNDEVIRERQKVLTKLLIKYGLIKTVADGTLLISYKQDKFVIGQEVIKRFGDEEVARRLNAVSKELAEIMSTYIESKDKELKEAFGAYYGLSESVGAATDDARILADMQALQAAKIARRKAEEGQSIYGDVFNQNDFDALVKTAQGIKSTLGLMTGQMPPLAEMEAVRGKPENQLEGRNKDIKKYLDIIDLFDYPKDWPADPGLRNIQKERILDLLKLLENIRPRAPPPQGAAKAVLDALSILEANTKNSEITSGDAFHYYAFNESLKNPGRLVAADAIGFWAGIQKNLADACRNYSEGASVVDESLAADDKVKMMIKESIGKLINVLGKDVARTDSGKLVVYQEGGDEIAFFVPVTFDLANFANAVSGDGIKVRLMASEINYGNADRNADAAFALTYTEVTHGPYGQAYVSAQEADKLAKRLEKLGVRAVVSEEITAQGEPDMVVYHRKGNSALRESYEKALAEATSLGSLKPEPSDMAKPKRQSTDTFAVPDIITSYLGGLNINIENGQRLHYGEYSELLLDKNNSNRSSLFQTFGFPVRDDAIFSVLFYQNKPIALVLDPSKISDVPPDLPIGCIVLADPQDSGAMAVNESRIRRYFKDKPLRIINIEYEPEASELLKKITGQDGPALIGFPGVFRTDLNSEKGETSKAIVESSYPLIKKGDKVLVVGCGRGIDVIAAALSEAGTVDAIDLSELEIRNTILNLGRWNLNNVNVINNRGLDGLGRYDVIIFNAPLAEMNPGRMNARLASHDVRGNVNMEFLIKLRDHLNSSGFAIYSNEYSKEIKNILDTAFGSNNLSADKIWWKDFNKTMALGNETIEMPTQHAVFKITALSPSAQPNAPPKPQSGFGGNLVDAHILNAQKAIAAARDFDTAAGEINKAIELLIEKDYEELDPKTNEPVADMINQEESARWVIGELKREDELSNVSRVNELMLMLEDLLKKKMDGKNLKDRLTSARMLLATGNMTRPIDKKSPVVEKLLQSMEENMAKHGFMGIPFEDFMRISLASERGGYYATGKAKISSEGEKHFKTFVETLHPYFGKVLAAQAHNMWNSLDRPGNFTIVEMGVGNGTLAKDILEEIEKEYPEFFDAVTYMMVDLGFALVDAKNPDLKESGARYSSKIKRVQGSAVELKNLPEIENGLFVSNELPDAFPVHRVRCMRGELREMYVDYDKEKGLFVERWRSLELSPRRAEIEAYLQRMFPGKSLNEIKLILEPGDLAKALNSKDVPVNLDMLEWQKSVASKLKRGYVITVDYTFAGGNVERYLDFRGPEVKTCIRMYGGDALDRPGEVDITSDVPFDLLASYGASLGLMKMDLSGQKEFLLRAAGEAPHLESFDAHKKILNDKGLDNVMQGFRVLIQGKNAAQSAVLSAAVPILIVDSGKKEVICNPGEAMNSYLGVTRDQLDALKEIGRSIDKHNLRDLHNSNQSFILDLGDMPVNKDGERMTLRPNLTPERQSADRFIRLFGNINLGHGIGAEDASKWILDVLNKSPDKSKFYCAISASVLYQLEAGDKYENFRKELGKEPGESIETFLSRKAMLDIVVDNSDGKAIYLMPYSKFTKIGLLRLSLSDLLKDGLNDKNRELYEKTIDLYAQLMCRISNRPGDAEKVKQELLAAAEEDPLNFFKDYIFKIVLPPITKIDFNDVTTELNAMAEVWKSL